VYEKGASLHFATEERHGNALTQLKAKEHTFYRCVHFNLLCVIKFAVFSSEFVTGNTNIFLTAVKIMLFTHNHTVQV